MPVVGHVLHRLEFAGAEVLAAALARQLKDRFRFVFICLDGVGKLGEELTKEGFPVVALSRKPGVDWAVARGIRQAVKEHGVGLLHAHQYTPFFYSALSRRLGATPHILFTEHGRHFPDQRKLKHILVNPWLLKKRDRVTAVGQFVKRALVENEGIPAHRIEVFYNGINPDKFQMADRAAVRAEVRKELNLREDQPVVLQVARFHPVKDHALSIDAFAGVVEEIPNAVLLLAGDGELLDAMWKKVGGLSLTANVRFMGVRTDIPRLMAAADVFCLSSLSEGISVTLLEAMASRLPIVATDVGGNGEVVLHNHNGLLSPRRDVKGLTTNLLTLLRDPQTRAGMAEAGHSRVHELFTQQLMHERFVGMYEQMLRK